MKTTRNEDEIRYYATMGKAALLPGMVKMLDLMQRQIDELRQELEAAQTQPRKVLGRPRKEVASLNGRARSGWSPDAEERSEEMKRRREVARQKKLGKLHPRDSRHPEHEAWKKLMSDAQKTRWKRMTPAQKREATSRLLAARTKRVTKPVAKLAVAS